MNSDSRNNLHPRFATLTQHHGVITLFGYGIIARVDRGHLLLEDGIGSDRRELRLPRVGHGLKRLVVIGSDGMISLSAVRWLADQDAAFVMLERDGTVLTTIGPVRSSDARLRRAQALGAAIWSRFANHPGTDQPKTCWPGAGCAQEASR